MSPKGEVTIPLVFSPSLYCLLKLNSSLVPNPMVLTFAQNGDSREVLKVWIKLHWPESQGKAKH
jgi:hypothetical protein